jgi:hypothetical protein
MNQRNSWQRNALAALVLSTVTPAFAEGPFGISMGTPVSELKDCSPVLPGKWVCAQVPRPHSTFGKYVIQAHPSTGVCWIKALTSEVSSNDFGIQLRSKFDEIASELNEVYGEVKDTSFIMPGSTWHEPKYWMMALLKGDRHLARIWNKGPKTPLKNNLKRVGIIASASSTSSGAISIEYTFENGAECDKAIKVDEKGSL